MVTQGGVHTPAAQARPTPQAPPQPPQCCALLVGSTHCPPQSTCGLVQVGATQVLPLHSLPPAQSPSEQHSKQPVEQHLLPLPHAVCAQAPLPVQTSVVHGSASLHCASVQESRDSLPQSLGFELAHWQSDPEQIAPALQIVPQAPQFFASPLRSTSQPSPAWPLQLANPARHDANPLLHFWFGPTGLPQLPQCCGSVLVSTHDAPQSVSVAPQLATHAVPSHTGVGAEHVAPQVPQFDGSVIELSQPGPLSQS